MHPVRRLIPIALWVGTTLQGGALAQPTPCEEASDPDQVIVRSLTDVVEIDSTTLEVVFRIGIDQASHPITYAPVLFWNGRQVPTDAEATLACGEEAVFVLPIERVPNEAGVVHLIPTERPLVPAAVTASLAEPLSSFAASIEAWRFSDTITEPVGTPSRPPRPSVSSALETRVATRERTGFFVERGDPRLPVFVIRLPEGVGTLDTTLFFSETEDHADQDAYAITCTVDNRQVPAFRGHPLWVGSLSEGEGVLLPVRFAFDAPGWHQVRCFVLNNLYGPYDRISEFPHLIHVLYVHLPDAPADDGAGVDGGS